jgi:hypothetical protein
LSRSSSHIERRILARRLGQRFGRPRVGLCALLIVALALAGCRSEPADDASGLRDLDDIPIEPEPDDAEPETDEASDVGADQNPDESDGVDGDGEDGPSGAAWPEDLVIPRGAVSINEDLDVDEEAQLALLRRYAEGYSLIVALFAGDEVEASDLEEHFSPDRTARILRAAADLEAADEVQLTEDSRIHWIRLTSFDGAGAIVERCHQFGPDSGIFARDTGQLVFPMPSEWRQSATSMVLLLDEGGPARWVLDDGGELSDAPCA